MNSLHLKICVPLSTKAINPKISLKESFLLLALTTVLLLLLVGCSEPVGERLWLKAPGWSRAEAVGGMAIPDPAPMVVDDKGNIYFLFINGELEALQAQMMALNNQGEQLWQHTFNDILKLPDDPRLTWDGQLLHAFLGKQWETFHGRFRHQRTGVSRTGGHFRRSASGQLQRGRHA